METSNPFPNPLDSGLDLALGLAWLHPDLATSLTRGL